MFNAEEIHGSSAHDAFRATAVPWMQWGEVEESAIVQMRNAVMLPVAVKDAVIPFAVGVDIACRMRLSVLDMPVSALQCKRDTLIWALEEETRFGVGAKFDQQRRRDHAVMEEDWAACGLEGSARTNAWKQHGTSGGGNHFVEFGELHLDAPALGLEAGVQLTGGGLDEAPAAYKNIHAVMAAQDDLVEKLARFVPRLVKMAPGIKALFRKKR